MTYTPSTYTDFKNSVRVASTGNVNISAPGASIDGVSLAAGNRVLLKNQTTASQNGVYTWTGAATPMVRTKDADQNGEMTAGSTSYVEQGTVNGKKTFTLTTTGTIVVGTTAITYEELTPTLANSSLNDLGDVDTSGVVDGSLLRYESTGTQWNDTSTLLFNDAGQLQVTTTGSSAGIVIGGDTQLFRAAADFLQTPDNFQSQNRIWANVGSASQVEVGDSGGLASIKFGSAGDTNLYRSAAGILASDHSIQTFGVGTAGAIQANDSWLQSIRATSTSQAIAARATGDVENRFRVRSDGQIAWSDGTNPLDVTLSRTAANILAMGAGDKIQQNAAPTVADDLVNKNYVDTALGAFSTTLDGLSDVDTTGVVDGALLRYESTGTTWNDTSVLLFSDSGQLQVTTTGAAAGLMLGGDAQLYRGAADVITVGAGDKIQQAAAPTVNDDLTNKLYVDTEISNNTPDLNAAFRRSWFGVG